MKAHSEEHKKKLGEISAKRWQDPEFRERMIKKQEALGYRLPRKTNSTK